jgi:hypothetical protein
MCLRAGGNTELPAAGHGQPDTPLLLPPGARQVPTRNRGSNETSLGYTILLFSGVTVTNKDTSPTRHFTVCVHIEVNDAVVRIGLVIFSLGIDLFHTYYQWREF